MRGVLVGVAGLVFSVALATATLAQAPRPAGDRRAPEQFRVRLDTTRGPIVIACTRAWAPLGADRFFTLVTSGYYDDSALFRVVKGSGRSSASAARRRSPRRGARGRFPTTPSSAPRT